MNNYAFFVLVRNTLATALIAGIQIFGCRFMILSARSTLNKASSTTPIEQAKIMDFAEICCSLIDPGKMGEQRGFGVGSKLLTNLLW